uniref:Ribonuclease H-like domain, reverse transcriptase, RNA-dependent DNA polymerase n=1 Tax=Tanacetum cinerariifolium TaxID=118510 RepID=A0A6L2KSY7_TANCI|nr:ribonuclease H-like domain, reverse transcriptase, RNA-dependent DNA polymerase [Tanacetum cinerariifolium]
MDKETTAFLYQALTEDVILQVAGCKTAKELWESLLKRHVGEEKVQQARLQSLMIGFQTLQMKEDDTMDAFTAKLNGYANKAKELGKTLDESLLVRKLLDSTPGRFIQIVSSIEKINDLDDITIDEIVRKLKAFEERIKLQKEGQVESQENLLFAHGEHSGKGRRFSKCGGQIQPGKYATADASIWYLDNGTSNHMTRTKSHFRDIDESVTGRVRFGDGSYVQIKGRGSILLGCKNNEQKIVSDIYYIPNLKSNILSLGQLTEIGYKIIMDGNKLTLYDKNKKLLIKVERSKNRLYSIRLQIKAPICLLANIDNQAWLWHARLGHLNFDDINKMTRNGLVEGIPRIKQQIKMEMRMKLRMLRTDRGGEFTSNEFTKYCKENGIARQLKAPYSPQQNRVVERRNRTGTTRAMVDKTPYEALYNRKPNLENLRIFRCTAYAKVTIPHLKKLDDRSIPMIYLGVEEGSKACRLYDPKGKRRHVSRDVRFMKTKPWDWDNNGKETSSQDTFWASFVEPITDPDSPITLPAYTYNPNSEEEEEEEANISSLINSENQFDNTPVRGLKWVFKTKRDAKGKIIKYKARLVAKGYVQEQGIDFDEVFTPVARIEIVRLILALAAYHEWQVHHLDVKSAFLHGDLKEEVYVTQPEGFIQQGNSGKVYKLNKAFKTSTLIVGVYVDDLIITGTPRKGIDLFKSQREEKIEMTDLGLLAYYLGIEVTQTGGVITIKQTGYINKILKEISMMESNDTKIPMDPGTKLVKAEDGNSVDATYYRSLIGSLRYLLHIRPDLSYSVGLLSRFMEDPKDHHLKAVKQVIRYIKGTKEHGIIYKKEGGCNITGYSDSSYRINTDQGKGTTGIVFYFGESPITWCTQKQPTVALSSCESEFMAATRAACQALWLKRLLSEITGINMEHISGELQRADILTKALPRL